jgi:hypothetical protein
MKALWSSKDFISESAQLNPVAQVTTLCSPARAQEGHRVEVLYGQEGLSSSLFGKISIDSKATNH